MHEVREIKIICNNVIHSSNDKMKNRLSIIIDKSQKNPKNVYSNHCTILIKHPV